MAGEEAEEGVAVGIPRELAEWLDAQAGDGRDRETLLRDLLAAHRRVAEGDVEGGPPPAELADRLESQREEYVDLVEDVRERVIQVKREADGKAPVNHDHPDLSSAVDSLDDRVGNLHERATAVDERLEGVEASLAETRSTVDALQADLESGFENYEDVLEYLTDRAEETDDHLDALARAVVDLRETTRSVAAAETAREEADRLKLAANREGVTEADCEECGESLSIGLLPRPECPHCESTFVDVEPKSGLIGSATLVVGADHSPEEGVGVGTEDLTGMVEDDDEPSVDLAPEDEDT